MVPRTREQVPVVFRDWCLELYNIVSETGMNLLELIQGSAHSYTQTPAPTGFPGLGGAVKNSTDQDEDVNNSTEPAPKPSKSSSFTKPLGKFGDGKQELKDMMKSRGVFAKPDEKIGAGDESQSQEKVQPEGVGSDWATQSKISPGGNWH
jgi:hypothetical protein